MEQRRRFQAHARHRNTLGEWRFAFHARRILIFGHSAGAPPECLLRRATAMKPIAATEPNHRRALELTHLTAREDARIREEASNPWSTATSPLAARSSALAPRPAITAPASMAPFAEPSRTSAQGSPARLSESHPAAPIEALPAAQVAATAGRPPSRAPKAPVQDEWGLFNPAQCGFEALFDKLDDASPRADESSIGRHH